MASAGPPHLSLRPAWASWLLVIYVVGCVPLFLEGLSPREPRLLLTIGITPVVVGFVLFCLPWIVLAAVKAHRRSVFVRAGGILPRSMWWWVPQRFKHLVPTMVLVLTYIGCASGIVKLLHRADREPGQATLTVKEKFTPRDPGSHCPLQVIVEGFDEFGNRLCLDAELFNSVRIGDRMRVTGMVSPYAIEPHELELRGRHSVINSSL